MYLIPKFSVCSVKLRIGEKVDTVVRMRRFNRACLREMRVSKDTQTPSNFHNV